MTEVVLSHHWWAQYLGIGITLAGAKVLAPVTLLVWQ